MVDWYLVSVLIFAAFLALLVYVDRKSWKRESILLIRKTQTGKRFLIWLGTRFPRFWLVVGVIAVVLTLLSSIWMLWALIQSGNLILAGQLKMPGGLLIPSPTNQTTTGPGYLAVPFWYWIISIAVLVVVHEGMHGVMAARERVRIKSLGWGLLAVIPMAFVEPDEKQLQRQKSWKQLRVFAAGSFANYIVAGAAFLFLMFAFIPGFFAPGVSYQGLIADSPAAQANLTGTIVGIDNYTIKTVQDLSDALSQIGPGKQITIATDTISSGHVARNTYTLTTIANPDGSGRGFIGISWLSDYQIVKAEVPFPEAILFLEGLLSFLFLINFGVGAFNMLPIGPLDGGRMWGIILKRITPKRSESIMKFVSIATGVLVIVVIFVLPMLVG
jgi:membrane-associated protease RseP (regulator of RpoE activity)